MASIADSAEPIFFFFSSNFIFFGSEILFEGDCLTPLSALALHASLKINCCNARHFICWSCFGHVLALTGRQAARSQLQYQCRLSSTHRQLAQLLHTLQTRCQMKQPVLPRQQAWDSIISAGAACSLPVLCFWRQQNQASAVAAASSNTTIGATIAATEPPLEGVLLPSGGAAVAFLEGCGCDCGWDDQKGLQKIELAQPSWCQARPSLSEMSTTKSNNHPCLSIYLHF